MVNLCCRVETKTRAGTRIETGNVIVIRTVAGTKRGRGIERGRERMGNCREKEMTTGTRR